MLSTTLLLILTAGTGEVFAVFELGPVARPLQVQAVCGLLEFPLPPTRSCGQISHGWTETAQKSAASGSADDRLSITGVRITRGDAVNCPQVRGDDGRTHTVSYLSPRVEIGGRVALTGYMGYSVKCLGEVLVVEEEHLLK
jgi:hypothetical protein